MSRYLPRRRDELDAEQAELYDVITNGPRAATHSTIPLLDPQRRLLGPFGPMTIQPRVGAAIQQVGAALRFSTDLSDPVREAAILLVAAHTGCRYEWRLHEVAAASAGLSATAIDSLRAAHVPDELDAQSRMALSLVLTLLRDGDLDDEMYTRVHEMLGERAVAELVWLVGYYSMLALALRVWRPPI